MKQIGGQSLPSIDVIVRLFREPVTRKQLRSFGLVVGGIFLLIGTWPLLRYDAQVRQWAAIPGAVLIVLVFVGPGILEYPYRIWMLLGLGLGWVNTRIIMGILFYLVFTPVSILMHAIKRDAMLRIFDPEAETYRISRSARDHSHMKHPF